TLCCRRMQQCSRVAAAGLRAYLDRMLLGNDPGGWRILRTVAAALFSDHTVCMGAWSLRILLLTDLRKSCPGPSGPGLFLSGLSVVRQIVRWGLFCLEVTDLDCFRSSYGFLHLCFSMHVPGDFGWHDVSCWCADDSAG